MLKKIQRTLRFLTLHPFASKHLNLAIYNWLGWQFRSNIQKKTIVLPFVNDAKFIVKKGMTGITGNIYAGLHEFNDMGFLLHLLRQGDHFVDVGANVGSYTILASKVRRAFTTSFEPVPSTFDWLKRNTEVNDLEELVELNNQGCSNESKILKFSKEKDTTNHVLTDADEDEYIEVETVSLDIALKHSPTLMKIDTEGFETEVLKGAQRILREDSLLAIIIELNGSGNRYGFDENKIDTDLKELGFFPYAYDPFNRHLTKLETFGDANTIYIRDIDEVSKRLQNAEAFMLWNDKI